MHSFDVSLVSNLGNLLNKYSNCRFLVIRFDDIMPIFNTKSLPKPVIDHCQLEPWKQTPVEFESKCNDFH